MKQTDNLAPQIPSLGIEAISNDQAIVELPEHTFPWIDDKLAIPTASIVLETGEKIRYGSVVGLHSGVEKLAKKVSSEQSLNAELGLFKAIPSLLDKTSNLPPNIDRIPGHVGIDSTLPVFKVAKQGKNAARLYFTVVMDGSSSPCVIKLGISPHDKQIALQNIMSGERGSRRKHDG